MPPGLEVHVADDLDVLADVAATILSRPAGAVLEPEWVVVPSAPVRQWLDWRLAERLGSSGADRHDGVAANMVNLFPEEFVRRVERAALASAGDVAWTSWDIDALTVRVLATSDRPLSVPEARALAQDIEDLVRWRPDVVRGTTPPTRAAEPVLRAYRRLGPPGDLPHDQRDRVVTALARGAIAALPARVLIYGLADVPGGPGFIDLVRGVATSADVVVLLSAIEGANPEPQERDDPRALASWAAESDDALRLWRTVAPDDSSWTFHPHAPRGSSVLATTGAALRGRATSPATADTTVQVVGACGLDRQVEQVRDLILDVASRDGLEPSDVLVASPDPWAVMDAIERHWLHDADLDLPRLPADPTVVLTADRRSRLDVSLALLATGRSRCTAADVLPLLSYPSVAETLGVSQGVRDRACEIVDAAHLTLGLSPQHREPFGVYGPHGGLRPDAGSWQRLLDRVVATSLLGPDAAAAGIGVPDDLDVVAALAPLLRTLDEVGAARTQDTSVATWLATLTAWVDVVAGDGPTLDTSFDEAARRLRRALGEDDGPGLSLGDFADLWSIVTRESSRQRVFGRGGVTVTDLASLAYAPHRVVCLVGLDDHRLPAGAWPSAVMGERRLGDPDPRRSALAAIRAALATTRDALIVTYTDRRLDDGRPLDPPVIIDELVEAVTTATGVEADHLTRTSPRHAASVPERVPGMIEVTWDPRAAGRDQVATPALVVDGVDVARVSWRDLRTFANGPVAFFLRRSWRADLPTAPPDDLDVPPLTLPPLRRAEVQRAFVWEMVAALRERYGDDSLPALPGAAFGHDECDEECAWLHDLARDVAGALFADEARNANVPPRLWRHRVQLAPLTLAAYNLACDLTGWASTPDEELRALAGGVALASGTRVTTDVVREVPSPLALHTRGNELALITLEARHGGASDWRRLLRSVVDVLVLTALAPERSVVATTYFLPDKAERYGRSNARYGSKEGHFRGNPRATLRVAPGADASALLERVVALFGEGSRAPIALFPETSVAAVATGLKRRAESEWRGRGGYGEADRVEHRLLYPLSATDVLGLDNGHLPYEGELTKILGAMEVEDLSQARRCHDGLGRAEEVAPQFMPLVGSS